MKYYKPRIADKLLKNKLEGKGAVLVEGAKWWWKNHNLRTNRQNQIIFVRS